MNYSDKDMFELIELHKQAQGEMAKHYFECETCQRYFNDINASKCYDYIKLDDKVKAIATEIEAYKIDID